MVSATEMGSFSDMIQMKISHHCAVDDIPRTYGPVSTEVEFLVLESLTLVIYYASDGPTETNPINPSTLSLYFHQFPLRAYGEDPKAWMARQRTAVGWSSSA